jgi:hypothetical protein
MRNLLSPRPSLCIAGHEGAFDPLRRVQKEADGGLTYDGSIANNRTVRSRPLLAHASGIHNRLSKAFFGRNQSPHNVSNDWRSLYLSLEQTHSRIRRHPVILIDSAVHDLCTWTTLGELLDENNAF